MAGETVRVIVPIAFAYKNRAGKFIQAFLDGFKEGKIKGARCPSCGNVYVPPRSACGKCAVEIEEIVELSGEGTIREFTVGHVQLKDGELKPTGEQKVIALIQLDGATSMFMGEILSSPDQVKKGARVRPVWADERKGEYSDLRGFEII